MGAELATAWDSSAYDENRTCFILRNTQAMQTIGLFSFTSVFLSTVIMSR